MILRIQPRLVTSGHVNWQTETQNRHAKGKY